MESFLLHKRHKILITIRNNLLFGIFWSVIQSAKYHPINYVTAECRNLKGHTHTHTHTHTERESERDIYILREKERELIDLSSTFNLRCKIILWQVDEKNVKLILDQVETGRS